MEAAACKDEEVFVVGGANSAGQAALHFARFACKVTMLVRGNGLSATMSKYLIDEIERTSNIVLETKTQVLEAMGEERLEALRLLGPQGEIGGAGRVAVRIYRGSAGDGLAAGVHFARREGICSGRAGSASDGKLPERLEGGARAVSAGDQRTGRFCGRRCPARLGEARGLGGGRGLDRGAVCAPVSGWILDGSREEAKDERGRKPIEVESIPLAGGRRGSAPDSPVCRDVDVRALSGVDTRGTREGPGGYGAVEAGAAAAVLLAGA